MMNLSISKNVPDQYLDFIDNCVNALFPNWDKPYDIFINFDKFVDDDGSHAGFCMGDEEESDDDEGTPERNVKNPDLKTKRVIKE